jgi:hypothetical protein
LRLGLGAQDRHDVLGGGQRQVSTITWTGHGSHGKIPPGAFRDFGLTVPVPGRTGDKLAFKAVQTYSHGEVVRWIGPEGSDAPRTDSLGRGGRHGRRRRRRPSLRPRSRRPRPAILAATRSRSSC